MTEHVETVVIGGGQGGLSVSYYLGQAGHDHVVLEQASQPAEAWRNHRWDSFTLNTPNWMFRLPGAAYDGDDPDGFMPRAEIVRRFEDYVDRFRLPVRFGVRATGVEPRGEGFRVETDSGALDATNVVIATGTLQRPRLPDLSQHIPSDLVQVDAGAYREPAQLPPGAVLVVGAGQCGCQIAEELQQSGRKVYLCIGKGSRAPRRYRGRDIFQWLVSMGVYDRTVDELPSPQARFVGAPLLSGTRGGHDLNLHQFVRDGVTLLGRLEAVEGTTIRLAPDLHANLALMDRMERVMMARVDAYIAREGLVAPAQERLELRDGYAAEVITELDLAASDVTSVVWAVGHSYDFRWLKLPILDEMGYPMQRRGVTSYPGLYFVGLHWLHTHKSGLLYGVGEDAAYVAAHLLARR